MLRYKYIKYTTENGQSPTLFWSNETTRFLVTANVPSVRIISTLKIVNTLSFEKSVLTRPTGSHIPEDSTLHSYCPENLKSCMNSHTLV